LIGWFAHQSDKITAKSMTQIPKQRQHLLGFSRKQLEDLAVDHGWPAYRGRQLFTWLYAKEAETFAEMSDLPKEVRAILEENYIIRQLQLVERDASDISETTKFLWQLADGRRVESVWIPDGERRTICISSQVGCALACEFCQTGRMGFMRNLSSGEIIEQILQVRKAMGLANTNVVFMGMGEPFLNYDNVVRAAQIMTAGDGIGLGNRRVTISTAGITPRIRQFTEEGHKMRLALSLNHSHSEGREKLMPITKKYPLDDLLRAVHEWATVRKDRITFEYVLIKGVNDGRENARQLLQITRSIPNKINVIPLNSNDPDMQPPTADHIETFMQWLSSSPWMITVRRPRGRDIKAACGMLYAQNQRRKLNETYHFDDIN
jgi:23S rRNA (adenine2503-C2)-methyltransferase